jgi:hypothetical protein
MAFNFNVCPHLHIFRSIIRTLLTTSNLTNHFKQILRKISTSKKHNLTIQLTSFHIKFFFFHHKDCAHKACSEVQKFTSSHLPPNHCPSPFPLRICTLICLQIPFLHSVYLSPSILAIIPYVVNYHVFVFAFCF